MKTPFKDDLDNAKAKAVTLDEARTELEKAVQAKDSKAIAGPFQKLTASLCQAGGKTGGYCTYCAHNTCDTR